MAGKRHVQEIAGERETVSAVPAKHRRLSFLLLAVLLAGVAIMLARQVFVHGAPGWDLLFLSTCFLPGWLAYDTPLTTAGVWPRRGHLAAMYGPGHIALLSALASYYGAPQLSLLSVGLLVVAGLWHCRHRQEIHLLFWIVSLSLVVYTLRLNDWHFSVVGDEFAFFFYARKIVPMQDLAFIGEHLFWGNAVYEKSSYLSSLIQAISMWVFDIQNFGWRPSSIYVSAISLVFLYASFRAFVQTMGGCDRHVSPGRIASSDELW